ncbi:MAG: mono/diheme cytochrome c family protein [Myxococcota bacterium]|jgi:mono/diheme cytochrome c family protein
MFRYILAASLLTLTACDGSEPTPEPTPEPVKEEPKPEPTPEPVKEEPKPEPAPATARTGEQVYAQVCIACHQANGEGLPGAFPPLVASDWAVGDPERPIKIILSGLQGPIEVKGTTYNSIMTPQGSILSDVEIANVLTYVRSTWGNAADAVTAEQVTAVRTATADRTAPWTVAELNAK